MTATFWGRNRSEKADQFVAEIEAAGGKVWDRYDDEDVEQPGWYTVVDYDEPEEIEEADEE